MKEEVKITRPDFKQWAKNLLDPDNPDSNIRMGLQTALEQAFNQGESYGIFKGYNAGYTRGYNEGFIKGQDAGQILRNLSDIVKGK